MLAISSYRGNRPTNKHSHKPTDRTDYNTASAQCNHVKICNGPILTDVLVQNDNSKH